MPDQLKQSAIQIISRTFLFPAQLENMSILSDTGPFVISIA